MIQRIVRQNFGRFRLCYENGLRNNPNLQGGVSVSFVIGRDGSVSSVSGGGDLPDSAVVSCVTRAFYGRAFRSPRAASRRSLTRSPSRRASESSLSPWTLPDPAELTSFFECGHGPCYSPPRRPKNRPTR